MNLQDCRASKYQGNVTVLNTLVSRGLIWSSKKPHFAHKTNAMVSTKETDPCSYSLLHRFAQCHVYNTYVKIHCDSLLDTVYSILRENLQIKG